MQGKPLFLGYSNAGEHNFKMVHFGMNMDISLLLNLRDT